MSVGTVGTSERVDVVVVGGGTAGLQAALQLAKAGRSVVLLERRAEGTSGARWSLAKEPPICRCASRSLVRLGARFFSSSPSRTSTRQTKRPAFQ